MTEKIQLYQVFGIQKDIPEFTYVDRSRLDEKYSYLLKTQRHIVVYGVSKQGKSCLRKRGLKESDSIIIHCQPQMTRDDILKEILRQLKVPIPTAVSQKINDTKIVVVEGTVSGGFPAIVSAETKGIETKESAKESENQLHYVDGYSLDIPFITEKLKDSKKRLVFEDFHYLNEDQRKEIAFLLKALFELGIFVIIIGIWAEQNLLVHYNGDLTGRIEEINIAWNDDELREVIVKGEKVLNVEFSEEIKCEMIRSAIHNVGLLQRLAERLCNIEGITEQQDSLKKIIAFSSLNKAREELVEEIGRKYTRIKDVFERGFRANTELRMYYQIFRLLTEIRENQLINGISQNEIYQTIHKYDDKIRISDLTAALSRIEKLQVERSINPLLVTYNHNLRLLVLGDREFIFFRRYTRIKWDWLPTTNGEWTFQP